MTLDEAKTRAEAAWTTFKSTAETITLWAMALSVLALVIHSWILLANGNTRGAIGALACAVLGAAGGVLNVEQWLAAAQSLVHLLGAAWGRADRAQCAKSAGVHAAAAVLWWVLLTYGGPIALGFGVPAPGTEEKLLAVSFWLVLVNHALRVPNRVRMAWLAAATPRAPHQEGVVTLQ